MQVKAAAREQHYTEAKAKARPRRKRGKQQEQADGVDAVASAKKSKNNEPDSSTPVVPAVDGVAPSGSAEPSGSVEKQEGDGNGEKRKGGRGAANPADVLAKWKIKEYICLRSFEWYSLQACFSTVIFLYYMCG